MTDDRADSTGQPEQPVPQVRLADADREAAVAALGVHRDAGRITGSEYEDRWMVVTQARVQADLVPVFADLPEPHAVTTTTPPADAVQPAVGAGEVTTSSGSAGGFDLGKVAAVMPFVALALFFTTGSWLWFLMIPAAGVLFGSTRNRH